LAQSIWRKSSSTCKKDFTDLFVQFGAGPLILSWINEICSGDMEKRALLVAMGNDLAYVVQAVVSLTFDAQPPRPVLIA